MLFEKLLALTFLTSAVSAYMVPEGADDGVYEHYIDDNGQEVHSMIANITDFPNSDIPPYAPAPIARNSARGGLVKRAYSCGGAKDLNHGVSIPLQFIGVSATLVN